METIVVAIPVDYGNARKACNLIENQVFESYGSLRTYLDKELDVNEAITEDILANDYEFLSNGKKY